MGAQGWFWLAGFAGLWVGIAQRLGGGWIRRVGGGLALAAVAWAAVIWVAVGWAQAEPTTADSVAYKVATLDAGRRITRDDSAIARADALLAEVAGKYSVSAERAGDMVAKGRDDLLARGVKASLMDMLDGALIVYPAWPKDKPKTADDLAQYIAMYAVIRLDGKLSHHEAVSSIIATSKALLWMGNASKSNNNK